MRFLVTGGAGFIGAALVKRLAADGNEVVVLDDFSRGQARRLAGVNCEVHTGDIRDEHVVITAMQGCDTVIHAAYVQGTQTFYTEPRQVMDVAMRGMLNVLAACERTGCQDLMLISSSEAYQVADPVPTPESVRCVLADPLNPRYSYGGGKLASEIMANAWARTGILERLVITRPHNIYGPDMGREHVIPEFCLRMNEIVAGQGRARTIGLVDFPIQGSGEETRSFCYIDDFIEQTVLALTLAPEGQEIYHLGQMNEVTISDIAHLVADEYRRAIKIIPGRLPTGSPVRRLPDTAKLHALGPLPAPVPLTDGVRKTVAWYKEHG